MTYSPFRTKRKRTLSWYLSTITPWLQWHSNLLWLTMWACAHFQSQSVVISWKISSKHSDGITVLVCYQVLFNFWMEKWVTVTGSLAMKQPNGQRAEQLQTPPAVWKLGAAKGLRTHARHSTEEIRTFHQKEGNSWMACDKSCYWVISDFQELVAMAQTDCMHSLFTSHFLLFISSKKPYFQDFDSKKVVFFSAAILLICLRVSKWSATEKIMLFSDVDAADLHFLYYYYYVSAW